MKILILDNNADDIKSLKEIIHNADLGVIVGETNEELDILEELEVFEPDLILIDLLYEGFDGFRIIEEISRKKINTRFIVISNEFAKETVENVYRYGAEFFVRKPINEYEVESIIKKVKYEVELENKIKKVQEIFNDIAPISHKNKEFNNCEQDIKIVLLKLGIISEIGSDYIVKAARYLIENEININDISIRNLCSRFSPNPKATEQKARRAINMALSNIASMGIEDYMNETFVEYSNTLFSFEQVKREMDYIRNKSSEKGSINMKRFLSGLQMICENYNN
ncbi:DNA-binding domain-containing protein [Tissierella sp.]|uniref:DNA-binding domain-containing protein n=1 Tax=Tissierella sp. TaxID=41274 RepID=UPI0028626C53|nr:DNA-binding domain-containing protein [Tissierella sp.]MDR7855437.1 DNA-binding domain-containing protein [Tissierella sp.]